MKNGTLPAFYNPGSFSIQGDDGIGLTKREYIATHILAGICANRWSMETGYYTKQDLAKKAIEQTDELLNQLQYENNDSKNNP